MKVFFVGAGPGDPELLTLKAYRLLTNCRVCIYAGSLISSQILALMPENAEMHNSAEMDLEHILDICEHAHARDIDVIRLHTGDPSIFGAIGEQMQALSKKKISYAVVPGVSSFQAAAATLCVELTAPEVSQTIILTRAEGRTPVPEKQQLQILARTEATLCIFLSVHAIDEIAELLAQSLGADCPAAIVHRASWPDERILRGTLATIAAQVNEAGIGKTAMIIVGRALVAGEKTSRLYDASFSHGYREARAS